MLNQRQVEILLEMMENAGTYMTASHFTERHGVSLHTVQGDMKAIRAELDSFSCLEYDSAAPKGSRVRILNEEEGRELRNSLLRQYSDNPNGGQEERLRQILLLLLRQHRSMSMYDVEPKVDLDLLKKIADISPVPIVLHGGSGIPFETIQKARQCGLLKINYGSDLHKEFIATFGRAYEQNHNLFNVIELSLQSVENVAAVAKNLVTIINS
jgi:hypothetical protein